MRNRLSAEEFSALVQRVRAAESLSQTEVLALVEEAEGLSADIDRLLGPQPCTHCKSGKVRPLVITAIDLELCIIDARMGLGSRDDLRVGDALDRLGRSVMELRGLCMDCARRAM